MNNGLPSFLENDPTVLEKKIPNFDSPVRVSISFGVQPQQPPAEETVDQSEVATEMEEPLAIPQAPRLEQPRRIRTPPPYLTAQLLESSEESDDYVELTTAPRLSTRIQEQQTNRLSERLLEVAGQHFQKTSSAKRTNQGQSVETRNFVDLLNSRQQRQQRQFVQRLGATQEGTSKKRISTDMNEIQVAQRTSRVSIVEDDLFGAPSSMGHCVSSDFFIGAGIAKRFGQLYPKMKTEASRELAPGSVFAFYDQYSRRCIYNLMTKPKYFHKLFYDALKNSLILMRNHAETHGVTNIRLLELGCGLDKLQPSIVNKILHEVFQKTKVGITVCIRNHSLIKVNC